MKILCTANCQHNHNIEHGYYKLCSLRSTGEAPGYGGIDRQYVEGCDLRRPLLVSNESHTDDDMPIAVTCRLCGDTYLFTRKVLSGSGPDRPYECPTCRRRTVCRL